MDDPINEGRQRNLPPDFSGRVSLQSPEARLGKARALLALCTLLVSTCSAWSGQQPTAPPAPVQPAAVSDEAPLYDPTRNASADIASAVALARVSGKRILLQVGGDWCPWCHSLHEFFAQHRDLREVRDAHFITVPVFYSREEKNEKALQAFPKVRGIPFFFVLDSDGILLCAQDAVDLETKGTYDPQKMKEFLTRWAAAGPGNRTHESAKVFP